MKPRIRSPYESRYLKKVYREIIEEFYESDIIPYNWRIMSEICYKIKEDFPHGNFYPINLERIKRQLDSIIPTIIYELLGE